MANLKESNIDNLDQMFEHTWKSPAKLFYDAFISVFLSNFMYLQTS